MSDQSTPFRASASFGRLVGDLLSVVPVFSVLAIVAGGFWFLVDLTISPLKNDVEELKGLKLGSRLARIEATLENINQRFEHVDVKFEHIDRRFERIDGRLQIIEAKQDNLIEATARLDGRVASLERVVRGSLNVRDPLRDPEGKSNEDTPHPR